MPSSLVVEVVEVVQVVIGYLEQSVPQPAAVGIAEAVQVVVGAISVVFCVVLAAGVALARAAGFTNENRCMNWKDEHTPTGSFVRLYNRRRSLTVQEVRIRKRALL